jgi:RHS repeat-associated protein
MNVAATLEREASYACDKNGNVTEVGTTTFYTYDFDNRLTQSSIWNGTGTTTTTYAYDPFGNRISQTASTTTTLYPSKYYSLTTITTGTSTVATSTDYLYSGATLLGTVDQKMVNGTASGTAITRYVHPNNLGSTNVTSDASGNLAQWLDYAPYGSVLASENTGTTTAARQYIGQFADPSGLSYLQNRYYNPNQAQFTSEDPTFLAVGNPNQVQQLTQKQQNILLADPQQLNAYSYGRDNPVTLYDPNGTQAELPLLVALGYIFTAYSTAQTGVDSYNYYNMNIKYANVTSPEEQEDAKLQLGYDALTEVTGQGLERTGLELSGYALDWLSAGSDAINTLGGSVYKFFSNLFSQNNNATPNVSMTPVSQASNSTFNNLYSNLSSNSVQIRQSAVSSINTGSGVSSNSASELWVTPNGAVVTWTGQVISSAPANSKQ